MTAETATVRPGEELDWPALSAYLHSRMPHLDGDLSALQFPHGSANLTYLVHVGDTPLVVRRPPFGRIAPGAHDMGREYRVLSRLHSAYPRAPRAWLFCEDEAVIGSPFLVSEYRPGVVVRRSIPAELDTDADAGRRIGLAAIDALADLHLVDPESCGLESLGRPDGYLERQVRGWTSRWGAVAGGDAALDMEEVARRMAGSVPESQRVSVLHNDFKVDNCQFSPGDPGRVTSVFDWDMATLGDPLADLGMLLNYWPIDDGAPEPMHASAIPWIAGLPLPDRTTILDRYATATGLDLGTIDWYEAFGCWKTAIILQQLYVRYLRGETTDPRMAKRGEHVAGLARKAAFLLIGDS